MPTEIRPRQEFRPQYDDPISSVGEWPQSRPHGSANGERRATGRRPFRALARLIIAALIGVGLTLAWQSYGEEGAEMARTYAPSLASLLPVPKTKSPADVQMPAAAIEMKQQLEPIALELVIVRRTLEQLAAKVEQLAADQERVAQSIATMQVVKQDVSQKTSSAPLPRAAPMRNHAQPIAQSSATQSPPVALRPSTGQPLRLLGR
jgi:hypothetical protein